MRIVLGIHSLAGSGGTESYTVTIGDHLQRNGHDVYVYSSEDGATGDVARNHGLRVAIGPAELPERVDACLVQDGIAALELLDARPEAALIYNWHSELFDVQVPPQIENSVKLNVVLHAAAFRRIKSLAVKTPVLQLTQPIDVTRFQPLSGLREKPRKLVALGNYLSGAAKDTLAEACEIAGLEFRHVGVHGEGITDKPALVMNEADIVVGKARVVLEAMACGRAAFVYDAFGSDGWVTHESYQALEAKCFAGTAFRLKFDAQSLAAELLEYDQRMGQENRELILENHNAMTHTGLLVAAIEDVLERKPSAVTNDNAFELGRLARVNWRHEQKAYELGYELREQSRLQQRTDATLEYTKQQLANETVRAEAAIAEARNIAGSMRWRALTRILRPLDRLRGRA